MSKSVNIGRLALRREGSMWNAYWARMNTMDGAVLLGSILISAVENDENRKRAFQGMMQEIMTEIIEDATGATPSRWDERAAPDNERGGTA
jgi:hypothetical protein